MALEVVTHIDELVATNPTASDPVSEGDDHVRNLKIAVLKNLSGDNNQSALKAADVDRVIANSTGGQIIGTLLSLVSAADADLLLQILNSDTPDLGLALKLAAVTGLVTLAETDGAGVEGNAWLTFTRGAGVGLGFAGAVKLASVVDGAAVTGQITASTAAPVDADHLTRKDYVYAAVAAVQADLNNVKNGFAFTGAISAPTVTET